MTKSESISYIVNDSIGHCWYTRIKAIKKTGRNLVYWNGVNSVVYD